MMDIDALADFNLVAREGGFGAASRASGRPKATLSRRVLELERALGVRLLDRGARALRLTEEGARLHARTAPLVAELVEAGREVRDGLGAPRGQLRVSAPVLLSQVALGRVVVAFAARHPGVTLELEATDRIADLVEEGIDVALRINPAPDTALVGRRVLRDETLVVAPPGWKLPPEGGAGGDPTEPVRAVIHGRREASSWRLETGAREHRLPIDAALRLPSLLLVREAVLAGVGAAVLPRSIVADDLAAGRLVLWGRQVGGAVEVWALHPSRRLMSGKVRAFMDHLVTAFGDAELVVEGG